MCDTTLDGRGRYISLFHTLTMNDENNIPLDSWLDDNVPDGFRVISIVQDKIVTDEIMFCYHVVVERIG